MTNFLFEYPNVSVCNMFPSTDLFWTAPEHLHTGNDIGGSQEGDIYGFGIILFELEERTGPFDDKELAPKGILISIIVFGYPAPRDNRQITYMECIRPLNWVSNSKYHTL